MNVKIEPSPNWPLADIFARTLAEAATRRPDAASLKKIVEPVEIPPRSSEPGVP